MVKESRDILLKLVRVAIGWEHDFSLPEGVDWREVMVLANEQGVNAIAIDGLEILKDKNSNDLSSDIEKRILLEAIGGLQAVEKNNVHKLIALQKLATILDGKNIPFLIMKGFACAQYYPEPKHRPCGDIDIYPGDKFEECNEALKNAGVKSNPYYYRHSASYINDVMIENHKVLGDLRGPRKQTREFEKWLEREAGNSIKHGRLAKVMGTDINAGKYPTANFNALFLPWHVSAHFAFEKVTLRHLLDWALFLTHDGKNIDVEMFREAKNRFTFGYSKISDILTDLSIRYLGMPKDGVPSEIIEDANNVDRLISDKVLVYMFKGTTRERDKDVWVFRWNNVKQIWRERWKYRQIFGMSFLQFLLFKVYGVLFKVGEVD